ncbi:MAG: 50S ribosomal protein L5 [Candidatus Lightella neohaematopini]|nr:50S ribosomal protein L5 [Candidatus Lightella neohaematopini]
MSNLYKLYKNKISYNLFNELHCKSIMQVPKIDKITINMGVGKSVNDKKILNNAISDLTLISGQKPVITKAKKSISNFKIRAGYPIGCKVTLRKHRMWDFVEKLLYIAIPRIRDFRGLSTRSFDGMGNYNMGIKEQIIFPEIDYNKIDQIRGLDISITTNTKSDKNSYKLLVYLGFPFINRN